MSVSTEPSARKPLRILICESNALSAILLRRLFELRGHVAKLATTVDQASAAMAVGTFDRLVIDTHLVTNDTERILDRFERGAVIALTTLSARDADAACSAAGIATYLSKPVVASQLWAALDDTRE